MRALVTCGVIVVEVELSKLKFIGSLEKKQSGTLLEGCGTLKVCDTAGLGH